MRKSPLEKIIECVYNIPYNKAAYITISTALVDIENYVNERHFLKHRIYLKEVDSIRTLTNELSEFSSSEDKILQKQIQRRLANLARTIVEENKKIFIVHGRNTNMRDKVSSLLGRLKLDYVILESEHSSGATVIEKFIRNAEECRYAIVLFSAEDIGKLNTEEEQYKIRARQNVVFELGYFIGSIGRESIIILHDIGKEIEKPTDFAGVVYEPFDEYGGWKSKLIKEMKVSGLYIDSALADRV